MIPCPQCDSKGLIRVAYESGEPYDLAICSCSYGRWWARSGEPFIRQQTLLAPENRVAHLEDFVDEGTPKVPAVVPASFLEAGKSQPRKAKR